MKNISKHRILRRKKEKRKMRESRNVETKFSWKIYRMKVSEIKKNNR